MTPLACLRRYALAVAQDALREAIASAARTAEPDAVAALVPAATFDGDARERVRGRALALAAHVRRARRQSAGADALMNAFALSSDEVLQETRCAWCG